MSHKGKKAANMNKVPHSKTLDSIASLPKTETNGVNGCHEVEFKRSGILIMAKSAIEGSGDDLLFTGTLTISKKTQWQIPTIDWQPTQERDEGQSECQYGSSFSDREWTLVNDQLSKRNVRPIELELCELKSFRLSDDGNRMVLIQKDGTRHPPLIFLDEGCEEFVKAMRKHYCVKQSHSDENLYLLSDARMEALDRSLSQLNLFDKPSQDAVWKFVSDIQRDPVYTTLNTFSKIADRLIFSQSGEDGIRPEEEMADLLQKPTNLEVTTGNQDDGAFEVVTSRPKLSENLPKVLRDEPLCQLDWELHWDEQGRVLDQSELVQKIFKGGVEQNVRSEVWKFLLDYYDFGSSASEREACRKAKVDDYFRMKTQWRSISADQEERFTAFKERKTQIEKDVFRTDRTHPFFEGDENKNIDMLQDILMTYIMYNFDLGYVQGMSDLLAPILYVMQNEVDAFWCFVGFMKRVALNFDFDQGGMKSQLNQLIELLKTYDPEFYSYLDTKDSGNLYFCFRWLLIWFKREFPFNDVMRIWEVIWTDKPCPNFHLIICLALMDLEKKTIIENGFGFTEILKHINDMANSNVSISAVLARAEAIYEKLSRSMYVSNAARRVLKLPLITEQDLHRCKNEVSPMHQNGISPRRRRHQNSGNSESSVEVLPDLETEEQKFENALLAAGPF
eukprot:06165.XXX_166349_168505_1 [CDS] Oithona nana genome sequencing.